jgi:hypothetical protein
MIWLHPSRQILEEGDLVLKEMVSQSAVEWKVRLGGGEVYRKLIF